MTDWVFTTPTVEEAPFAWNPLMERFRIPRAISIVEVSPCVYKEVRYDSYTNELGASNYPDTHVSNPDFWPQPHQGLNFFRGGYEWIVDDATKACLIGSGLVTSDNFIPVGESLTGFGLGGFGEGSFGG